MIVQFFIGLIRLYRSVISPYLFPRCRFNPTCSHYALQALQIHGLRNGSRLTMRRLCRCHPFSTLGGKWGYDPVPPLNIKSSN